jgi:hypothetical protein
MTETDRRQFLSGSLATAGSAWLTSREPAVASPDAEQIPRSVPSSDVQQARGLAQATWP